MADGLHVPGDMSGLLRTAIETEQLGGAGKGLRYCSADGSAYRESPRHGKCMDPGRAGTADRGQADRRDSKPAEIPSRGGLELSEPGPIRRDAFRGRGAT